RSFLRLTDIPKEQYWSIERGSETGTFAVRVAEGDEFKALPDVMYRREGDKWVQDNKGQAATMKPNIAVTQALNRWPKLAIVDSASQTEKVVFDPNPQFQHRRFGRAQTVQWIG